MTFNNHIIKCDWALTNIAVYVAYLNILGHISFYIILNNCYNG